MCGIAGVVTAGRPLAGSTDVARVLAAALAHRGPDGEGTWTSPAGAARLVGGEPSAAGVLAFLAWGSVIPPLTWQRGVEMLAPGPWCRWRDGRVERGVFADARDAYRSDSAPQRPEREYRDEVAAAV